MATQVPLKIRVDIRDLWDSPTSEVQTAAAALTKTLGYHITPIVQWPTLHNALKGQYPDIATFIPSISRIVVAWYGQLKSRLDSGKFPEWTENLLGLLSSADKHHLMIEPSPPPHDRPFTKWNARSSCFYLGIPKTEPPPSSKVMFGFNQDFENLLKQDDGAVTTTEDGWDDLAVEPSGIAATSSPKPAVTTHSISTAPPEERPRVYRIPNIAELPRPDVLFAQRPPYVLMLNTGNPLTISCSHEASLQLLQTYFYRWGRVNSGDSLKRNFFKVELVESSVLSGVYDSLTIGPFSNYQTAHWTANPVLILAFIEGTLGYKLVHTDGRSWVYKLDTILM